MYILQSSTPHTVINMYGFTANPPMTHHFDISLCFKANQMRHFVFKLPSDSITKAKGEREKIRYATQESLAVVGEVSALRINGVEVRLFILRFQKYLIYIGINKIQRIFISLNMLIYTIYVYVTIYSHYLKSFKFSRF